MVPAVPNDVDVGGDAVAETVPGPEDSLLVDLDQDWTYTVQHWLRPLLEGI